jgi:hypothetical protein
MIDYTLIGGCIAVQTASILPLIGTLWGFIYFKKEMDLVILKT